MGSNPDGSPISSTWGVKVFPAGGTSLHTCEIFFPHIPFADFFLANEFHPLPVTEALSLWLVIDIIEA
jgi:hypothetical protein